LTVLFTTETRRHGENSKHFPHNAAPDELGDVKIKDEPYLFVCQSQISEQLGLMNGKDVFDAFEFQNECILSDEIDSIPAFKADILISDGK
jgi:hypothetical protein